MFNEYGIAWAADSFDWWRFVLVQKDGARFVVVRDTGERTVRP